MSFLFWVVIYAIGLGITQCLGYILTKDSEDDGTMIIAAVVGLFVPIALPLYATGLLCDSIYGAYHKYLPSEEALHERRMKQLEREDAYWKKLLKIKAMERAVELNEFDDLLKK